MTTERHEISVEGVPVEIVRKRIKNIHLAVHPPEGRVRLSVPLHIDDEAARMAVVTRLPWIRRKCESVRAQARQSARDFVSGESHYFQGRRYRLEVVETGGPAGAKVIGVSKIRMSVPADSTPASRERVLDHWYRRELRERVPVLIDSWSSRLNVTVEDWRIKRMKTRWGSCSVQAKRIWLNLELAKKSDRCLEYIVAHELMHLVEPKHGARFRELMDKHLPDWRTRRDELNRAPLAHEDWGY